MQHLFRIKGFLAYSVMIFLNAFVDLGHKIVIQNTVFKVYDGQEQIILTAIVNALILLPFIFLFSPAGFLSDRYPKARVMRYTAWGAVIAAVLITASYYAGWFWCAFSLTLLLAVQSAFYSPAKYGYIRELVGDNNLAQANGLVQAITIVSILAGTFVFSGLFELYLLNSSVENPHVIFQAIAPLGWVLIALTLFELFMAYRLPFTTQGDESKTFKASDYVQGAYLRKNIKAIRSKKAIWLSIIGLSMFWALSQVVLATFPAFAKETLEETNTLIIQGILACSGIGIVIGSLFAGRISKNYIELGLIPVGALGLALVLSFLPGLDSRILMALTFILIGVCGGIFIVPLNALIQYHANDDERGTVLAGNNWVQNIAMLSFLVMTVVFAWYGFKSAILLMFLAVIALVGSVYTVYQLPHSLTRLVATFIFKRRYKIEVVGFDHLPREGGVLLLGNHISWIDWAMVQIASPRPVRFVMLRSIYNLWFLKPIFKLFGVIPISAGNSRGSLEAVNKLLAAGEVVCLFPEGAISQTGQLGKFHSGYERAVEGLDENAVTIVPFYLRGLWGSKLSKSFSEKLRRNTSDGVKRDIVVTFGPKLPITTQASELKQKVSELSFDAWESYVERLDPLPLAWIRSAKQNLNQNCAIDTLTGELTNAKMLAATAAFAHRIKKLSKEQNVGLLLPASNAGLIANMAVMLCGKTSVNLNYTTSVEAVQAGMNNAGVKTVYTSAKFLKKLQQRGVDTDAMLAGVKVLDMEDIKASITKPRLITNLLAAYLLPAKWFYRVFGKTVDLNDPAAILFSSGSEGAPKGIVLSHKNFMANIKQISDVLNTRDDDVVMGSLPPFHSFGLTVTSLLPLVEGIPVVCHADPTDAVNIAKAIARHNVTVMCATATFLRLYIKNRRIDPLMLDSLRVVVAGAEKLPKETREEFKLKFNKDIYEGYGATETTPVASVNIPDKLDTNYWSVQTGNKPGTVGLPLPGASFRIVDPETYESLPNGEDGLILISGTQVMLGYLNDEEKTQDVIVELDGRRWYKTGDKGHLDKDGFLVIVDRYSRFAKIGGEMISLGAVEQVVRDCLPEDMKEQEIMAVNVPDAKKGEMVVLLTEGSFDTDECRKFMLAEESNALMIPGKVFQVETLPKLGSGKADFKAGKTLAMELINSAS